LQQELLSQIVEKDPSYGIELARDRIRGNPSDPAVISTLPIIAGSGSPQAMPFLFFLAANGSSSPNTRSQAVFWIARNSDKDGMGKAVVDLMKEKVSISVVTDVLSRFNPNEQRKAIDQIAQTPDPERLPVLENIFRSSTNQSLKTQIVHSLGLIREPAALHFLTDVAQNEREITVRRAAIQSLTSRDDTPLKTLDMILKTLSTAPEQRK
jgi:HEAT repeat protein